VDRSQVAAAMMEAFLHMSCTLLSGKEAMLAQYRADCITLGQEISLVRGEEIRYGKALDVDDSGALVVTFSDGSTKAVNSGEVSVRGMYGYI
jgi:BirA family biotin operon repressor/biotin-[acetyl-CoA-carboxylase] ligase